MTIENTFIAINRGPGTKDKRLGSKCVRYSEVSLYTFFITIISQ